MDMQAGLCAGSWVVRDRASKGCSKFRPGISDTPSDRWDQQQGILGHRPTQKSGRAGIGVLRSVFKERIPSSWHFMGAVFSPGKEDWQWLGEGRRVEIPRQLVVGVKTRPRKGLKAEGEARVVCTLEGHICVRWWWLGD